jgi:hypothetical protein
VKFGCALVALAFASWLSIANAADELALTNDDLCGTSLLGDEGSQGRSDEDWNRRLEEFFRSGGGLKLQSGRIEHEGPAGGAALAWLGAPTAGDGDGWIASDHLDATRYEVAGFTVLEVSIAQSPYVRATVFAWFPAESTDAGLSGAAVLVSNDSGTQDDNGYFLRSWNEQASGSVTLERPRWPQSGIPRLAIDLVYKSKRIGVAGELHALVAVKRVPEGDATRIGRFLRDSGIVRAPCLHPDLDPLALDEARSEMERAEAMAVIRAAADFVVFDAAHSAGHEPAARAEVRCPGGRIVASADLFRDALGTARQLKTMTARTKSIDETLYSYDTEGRLRFLRMESKLRNSQGSGFLEVWYDETGGEAGSKLDSWIVRPRPGTDPSAEIEWVKEHETELRKACEPGW